MLNMQEEYEYEYEELIGWFRVGILWCLYEKFQFEELVMRWITIYVFFESFGFFYIKRNSLSKIFSG